MARWAGIGDNGNGAANDGDGDVMVDEMKDGLVQEEAAPGTREPG